VFVARFDDHLRREQSGADQHAERQGADDGNSGAVRCKSAREPAEAVRVGGTNRAVRRWDGVLLDGFWDRCTGHDGGIGLSRRWTALKFSILCGPKTSVNAIFHPQPPFSISRRQNLHCREGPRASFRVRPCRRLRAAGKTDSFGTIGKIASAGAQMIAANVRPVPSVPCFLRHLPKTPRASNFGERFLQAVIQKE
jgi:hypothetical protein